MWVKMVLMGPDIGMLFMGRDVGMLLGWNVDVSDAKGHINAYYIKYKQEINVNGLQKNTGSKKFRD